MRPSRRVTAQVRKLKPGTIVRIDWLDSGSEDRKPTGTLSRRWCYGAVHGIKDDVLTVAMDVCKEDEHGTWGHIWIPCIFGIRKLS